jgi:hypothetical protein
VGRIIKIPVKFKHEADIGLHLDNIEEWLEPYAMKVACTVLRRGKG